MWLFRIKLRLIRQLNKGFSQMGKCSPQFKYYSGTIIIAFYTVGFFVFAYMTQKPVQSPILNEEQLDDPDSERMQAFKTNNSTSEIHRMVRAISKRKHDLKTLSDKWHVKYPQRRFKRMKRTRQEYIQGDWSIPRDFYKVHYTHSPGYLIKEKDLCITDEDRHPLVLFVFVESAPINFDRRRNWREKWGVSQEWLRVAFVLGLSTNHEVNKALYNESNVYNDVILLNFTDSYKGLTIKTATMLEWVSEYCSNAGFALKTDDDVFVHFDALRDFLDVIRDNGTGKILAGAGSSPTPLRMKSHKWRITYEEYPFHKYPSYVLGSGILMSQDTVQSLRNVSQHIAPFPFEDVFVGLCARAAEIRPLVMSQFQAFEKSKTKLEKIVEDFFNGSLMLAHGLKSHSLERFWKIFQTKKHKLYGKNRLK